MRRNHSTTTQTSVTRFALGQTFITATVRERAEATDRDLDLGVRVVNGSCYS